MNLTTYNPNRVYAQVSTSSIGWQIVGLAGGGTGYTSYAALLAAGDTPFPGSPADFPMGLPNMIIRTVATGGVADGGTVAVRTNTLATPGTEDDLVSAAGQTLVYTDEAVKSVWVKKTTASDIVVLTGLY